MTSPISSVAARPISLMTGPGATASDKERFDITTPFSPNGFIHGPVKK